MFPGMTDNPGAVLYLMLLEVCALASIALHELGHSYVAIRNRCRVRAITLTFIGGIAEMENIPLRPRAEFLMATAGPAVSLALGALCILVGTAAGSYLDPILFLAGIPLNFTQCVGVINVGLAFFNMIPAFPMDGGRVLRAWLAPQLGRLRATLVASIIGKAIAVFLGLVGLLGINTGLWMLMIVAGFVFFAAGHEYRLEELCVHHASTGFAHPPRESGRKSGEDVIIGPPPYEKGRTSKSRIRSDRNNDGRHAGENAGRS